MKQFKRIQRIQILLLTAMFFLSTNGWAQSTNSKEILKQYIAELQNNPSDSALREKIINLVLTMKPKPPVPAEVVRLEGAAEYAIKNAKTESDFADAAAKYEKALLMAPWLADEYFNCGVAYEKAGKLKNAIDSFNLYLLAATNTQDANEVQKRIGGLEYAIEKAAKDKVEQAALESQRRAEEAEQKNKIDFSGKWKYPEDPWPRHHEFIIYGDTIKDVEIFDDYIESFEPGERSIEWEATLQGRVFKGQKEWRSGYYPVRGNISEDNKTITIQKCCPGVDGIPEGECKWLKPSHLIRIN